MYTTDKIQVDENTHIYENLELTKNLAMLVKKHESQSNNLQLASECSDHLIEAYDVLLALYETPTSGDTLSGNDSRRATVETVAKHLISRLDLASTVAAKAASSSAGDVSSSLSPSSENHNLLQHYYPTSHPMAWDESSGYSHTTR